MHALRSTSGRATPGQTETLPEGAVMSKWFVQVVPPRSAQPSPLRACFGWGRRAGGGGIGGGGARGGDPPGRPRGGAGGKGVRGAPLGRRGPPRRGDGGPSHPRRSGLSHAGAGGADAGPG